MEYSFRPKHNLSVQAYKDVVDLGVHVESDKVHDHIYCVELKLTYIPKTHRFFEADDVKRKAQTEELFDQFGHVLEFNLRRNNFADRHTLYYYHFKHVKPNYVVGEDSNVIQGDKLHARIVDLLEDKLEVNESIIQLRILYAANRDQSKIFENVMRHRAATMVKKTRAENVDDVKAVIDTYTRWHSATCFHTTVYDPIRKYCFYVAQNDHTLVAD